MTRAEIDRAEHWFTRWGALAVLIGRAVPGVGGVICIPAGMARMGTALFLLASGPGALFWSALLVASGYVLQANFSSVDRWLNPISAGFAAVVAAIYLWRVVRYRPRAPT
jgi:membrane protein DedA with SNARE-associated domain